MFSIITQLYPLFLSSFCIVLGFGLIGLLMPVRLAYEGVELDVIGLILAMYAAVSQQTLFILSGIILSCIFFGGQLRN